ncbi:hypothetical protein [Neptunomonas japonica]|uniref:hypothetical protein n=1 Tax=Neptunomonas japonica TaxID=417574 RepID=UPI0004157AE2|nr:hypothetical protein [Neptunomonas japonica]
MSAYYVIDLQRTDIQKGIVVFLAADMKTRTRFLEDAGSFMEEFINENLERFDNGSTTRAVLTSAVKTNSRTILPLRSLHLSSLFHAYSDNIRRQAI